MIEFPAIGLRAVPAPRPAQGYVSSRSNLCFLSTVMMHDIFVIATFIFVLRA
jgi:hypothetical protein